jgi:hypothetical protein
MACGSETPSSTGSSTPSFRRFDELAALFHNPNVVRLAGHPTISDSPPIDVVFLAVIHRCRRFVIYLKSMPYGLFLSFHSASLTLQYRPPLLRDTER